MPLERRRRDVGHSANLAIFYLLLWLLPAIGHPEWLIALFIQGLASLIGFAFLLDEHLEPRERPGEQTATLPATAPLAAKRLFR